MSSDAAVTGRGQRTAARLRQSAREVFAEVGYIAARVEDIVSGAEVSHGTFYTYYHNKADVLADLVAAAAARLTEVAAAPWEDGREGIRVALERIIGRFLEVYADESDVVRAWVEAAAVDAEFASLLRRLRGQFVDRVAQHLESAGEAGGHDAGVAASALVAMVEGYAIEHLGGGQMRVPNPAVIRTLAALWHGGLFGLASPQELNSVRRT